MDDCLVDTLFEEKLKGQEISGTLTKSAYQEAARAVSNMFNLSCSSDHVKNRIKTLKKHLADAKDVLNLSGFGFNYATGVIEAEGKVWNPYLKAKPTHSYLRHTLFIILQNLMKFMGMIELQEIVLLVQSKDDINGKWREMIHNNDVLSSSKAGPSSSSFSKQSQEKKRTRTIDIVSEEIKSIKEGLDAVAAALDR